MKFLTFILAATTTINTCGLVYLLSNKFDSFDFPKVAIEEKIQLPEVENTSTLLSSTNFFFIVSKVFFGITKVSTIIAQGGLSTTVVGFGSIIFLYKYSGSILSFINFPSLLKQYACSQITLKNTTDTISNSIDSLVNRLIQNANKGSTAQLNQHSIAANLVNNIEVMQAELNGIKKSVIEERHASQLASQSIAVLEENVRNLIEVYINSR